MSLLGLVRWLRLIVLVCGLTILPLVGAGVSRLVVATVAGNVSPLVGITH
jgi:hypothetical protein